MADQEIPEDQTEHGEDALDDTEEVAEYSGFGFDPEQRRFLWVLTGVLILGMGASVWILANHEEHGRQTAFKVQELTDIHRATQQRLAQAEQADFGRLVNATIQNDGETKDAIMNEFVSLYKAEQQAYANIHRTAGLDDVNITEQSIRDFADDIMAKAMNAAKMRPAQRPASTQSTTSRPS